MDTQYVKTFQAILCQWSGQLSQPEVNVLLFINERTSRYQKNRETIPMRHFLQGVISKTGDRVISGLRHNKSTITKAYKSLQKKGLITIGIGDEIKGTNSFAINFKKILQGAKDMAKLKIGKKRQKQSENTTKVGVSQRDRGGVSEAQLIRTH